MSNNLKKYDANQVLRSVFDVTKNTLRVSIVDGSTGGGGGGFEVVITHLDDSIKLGNGSDLLTSTYIGPKIGLDTNIINLTLPLPTGASTEAKQDSEIAVVTNINSKLNTLGQKLMSGSVPVVIASNQMDEVLILLNEILLAVSGITDTFYTNSMGAVLQDQFGNDLVA